ncbi:hypothetical protein ACTQ9L_15875 [Deinococcus wulumuqiensis]
MSLPAAGEEVSLKDTGRRRRAFLRVPMGGEEGRDPAANGISGSETPEAVKQRHRRFATELNYDPNHHVLVLQLPAEISGDLFAGGTYTVEVVRGKLTKMKLTEQQEQREAEAGTGGPE